MKTPIGMSAGRREIEAMVHAGQVRLTARGPVCAECGTAIVTDIAADRLMCACSYFARNPLRYSGAALIREPRRISEPEHTDRAGSPIAPEARLDPSPALDRALAGLWQRTRESSERLRAHFDTPVYGEGWQ